MLRAGLLLLLSCGLASGRTILQQLNRAEVASAAELKAAIQDRIPNVHFIANITLSQDDFPSVKSDCVGPGATTESIRNCFPFATVYTVPSPETSRVNFTWTAEPDVFLDARFLRDAILLGRPLELDSMRIAQINDDRSPFFFVFALYSEGDLVFRNSRLFSPCGSRGPKYLQENINTLVRNPAEWQRDGDQLYFNDSKAFPLFDTSSSGTVTLLETAIICTLDFPYAQEEVPVNWNVGSDTTAVRPDETCQRKETKGADYRGTLNQAESGLTCQFWNETSPQDHTRTPDRFPFHGLGTMNNSHNFCRNPDNKRRAWCYVVPPADSRVEFRDWQDWKYCEIAWCDPVPTGIIGQLDLGNSREQDPLASTSRLSSSQLVAAILGGSLVALIVGITVCCICVHRCHWCLPMQRYGSYYAESEAKVLEPELAVMEDGGPLAGLGPGGMPPGSLAPGMYVGGLPPRSHASRDMMASYSPMETLGHSGVLSVDYHAMQPPPYETPQLQVFEEIAKTPYYVVLRGLWQGKNRVAVKCVHYTPDGAAPGSLVHDNDISALFNYSHLVMSIAQPNVVNTFYCRPEPWRGVSPHGMEDREFSHGDYTLVLVQEYFDGGSLSKAIMQGFFSKSSGKAATEAVPLTSQIFQVAWELSQGLQHLHAKGIVHGDLNPDNVHLKSSAAGKPLLHQSQALFSERDSHRYQALTNGFIAKIADFGLLRSTDQVRFARVREGAQFYIPAEAQSRGVQTKEGDVYALGCVFWEMYHSRPCYMKTRATFCIRDPKFPRFPDKCPLAFAVLAACCTHQDPFVRPTMDEVVAVMQDVLVPDSAIERLGQSGHAGSSRSNVPVVLSNQTRRLLSRDGELFAGAPAWRGVLKELNATSSPATLNLLKRLKLTDVFHIPAPVPPPQAMPRPVGAAMPHKHGTRSPPPPPPPGYPPITDAGRMAPPAAQQQTRGPPRHSGPPVAAAYDVEEAEAERFSRVRAHSGSRPASSRGTSSRGPSSRGNSSRGSPSQAAAANWPAGLEAPAQAAAPSNGRAHVPAHAHVPEMFLQSTLDAAPELGHGATPASSATSGDDSDAFEDALEELNADGFMRRSQGSSDPGVRKQSQPGSHSSVSRTAGSDGKVPSDSGDSLDTQRKQRRRRSKADVLTPSSARSRSGAVGRTSSRGSGRHGRSPTWQGDASRPVSGTADVVSSRSNVSDWDVLDGHAEFVRDAATGKTHFQHMRMQKAEAAALLSGEGRSVHSQGTGPRSQQSQSTEPPRYDEQALVSQLSLDSAHRSQTLDQVLMEEGSVFQNSAPGVQNVSVEFEGMNWSPTVEAVLGGGGLDDDDDGPRQGTGKAAAGSPGAVELQPMPSPRPPAHSEPNSRKEKLPHGRPPPAKGPPPQLPPSSSQASPRAAASAAIRVAAHSAQSSPTGFGNGNGHGVIGARPGNKRGLSSQDMRDRFRVAEPPTADPAIGENTHYTTTVATPRDEDGGGVLNTATAVMAISEPMSSLRPPDDNPLSQGTSAHQQLRKAQTMLQSYAAATASEGGARQARRSHTRSIDGSVRLANMPGEFRPMVRRSERSRSTTDGNVLLPAWDSAALSGRRTDPGTPVTPSEPGTLQDLFDSVEQDSPPSKKIGIADIVREGWAVVSEPGRKRGSSGAHSPAAAQLRSSASAPSDAEGGAVAAAAARRQALGSAVRLSDDEAGDVEPRPAKGGARGVKGAHKKKPNSGRRRSKVWRAEDADYELEADLAAFGLPAATHSSSSEESPLSMRALDMSHAASSFDTSQTQMNVASFDSAGPAQSGSNAGSQSVRTGDSDVDLYPKARAAPIGDAARRSTGKGVSAAAARHSGSARRVSGSVDGAAAAMKAAAGGPAKALKPAAAPVPNGGIGDKPGSGVHWCMHPLLRNNKAAQAHMQLMRQKGFSGAEDRRRGTGETARVVVSDPMDSVTNKH